MITIDARSAAGAAPAEAAKVGRWAALSAMALAVAWLVLVFAFPSPAWSGIGEYASAFRGRQLLNTVPALALAPVMIVLMAALHACAAPPRRCFTHAGLACTAAYAAVIGGNYFVQLHAVRLALLHRELEGVALLAFPNLRSVFFSLERPAARRRRRETPARSRRSHPPPR